LDQGPIGPPELIEQLHLLGEVVANALAGRRPSVKRDACGKS
jgi:hypothetical protein